jgi:cell division protein FtsA
MSSAVVAGLDIGSSKTAVVIAEVAGEAPRRPQIKVLGVGQARTGGVRREVVTDLEATTESVRRAVKEAELMAGVSVERLYAGIAGKHIEGRASNGMIAVNGAEITARDVERVLEVARAVVVPADRELLHALPQEYMVDSQGGIRDPIGMSGTRLEAEIFLVTGAASTARNLRNSVTRAGFAVEELVFEPLASSMAVLNDDERDLGVALVDLGGGTTDVIVFHERKIRHLASLPWGGSTVTQDIVKGLSIPYAEARRVKDRWGAAVAGAVNPRESFEVAGAGPGQKRRVARELLAHIVEQRLDEIFGLVSQELERTGIAERLGAGVVLTGGGAALEGLAELAGRNFTLPVRVGLPGDGLAGLVDAIRLPNFATAVGLVHYGARRAVTDPATALSGAGGRPVNGVIKWMRDWLNDFF